MLLESLLSNIVDEANRHIILVVIQHINLLLCLVNDLLDLNMIERGIFTRKNEIFSPAESFKFVISMFSKMEKIYGAKL